MEIFADQIKRQLEIRNGSAIDHCAITDEELQRIWLLDEMDREKKIAQFAKEHGLYLTFYREGMCAIFEIRPNDSL
jgi:hypothetical protein